MVAPAFIKKLIYSAPQKVELNQADKTALLKSTQSIKGNLIFDSFRSGRFSIYHLDLSTLEESCIVLGQNHAIYPDTCSETQAITYAQADTTARNSQSSIWLLESLTEDPIKLADNGTFPTFSASGEKVYFEKERKNICAVNIESGKEELIFPKKEAGFGNFAVVKPRISPNQRYALFTTDKGGKWHTWCADLETQEAHKVVKGCEAAWFPDSQRAAWIRKYGLLGRVGIYGINALRPDSIYPLQDDGPPFGHEYFPSFTYDGKFLLYSACPMYEHDHITSNYQIFVKNLDCNNVLRLTYDRFTNRWPKLLKI